MTSEDPIRVLANVIFDEHCGYTIFQEDEDDTIAEIAFELENLVDSVKRKLSNHVKRHLEMVDERECSLKAWNAICDALLELHDDK